MDESFKALAYLVIPEGVSDYFLLTNHTRENNTIRIYLEEKNDIPVEYSNNKLQSKGFYEEITLQDFPMRGFDVFLYQL